MNVHSIDRPHPLDHNCHCVPGTCDSPVALTPTAEVLVSLVNFTPDVIVNWNSLFLFDNESFTIEECQQHWTSLQDHVRRVQFLFALLDTTGITDIHAIVNGQINDIAADFFRLVISIAVGRWRLPQYV